MYPDNDLSEDELVRSAESCWTDLLKCRAKWDKNSNRPYFEGHERLICICNELSLIESDGNSKVISLEKFREIISMHPAFNVDCTYLERLASSHGHKVLFCPKFHCKLNPVEGVFSDLKQLVRKNNDQDFSKINDLIQKAFYDRN
ncbi:unnamed protein product [Brachionus calyciflorus]|uniref:Tc1-like transposase DDE domain-containing protein n=1 Tax=Brachionus calyciflorus TaxID=104777 RepID=A0A813M5M8_9BILA|nr:unnamed protein product [Brachionus calyciflorus]